MSVRAYHPADGRSALCYSFELMVLGAGERSRVASKQLQQHYYHHV
jgi:hypothetical protein